MFPNDKCPATFRSEFGRVALALKPHLMRRAIRLTGDRDRAEDLVQATFEKAYCSFHRFEAGTNVSGWLCRILVNQFIDERRSEKVRPTVQISELMELASPAPDERSPWTEIEPQDIKVAASRLPRLCRESFCMRYFERLPYRQIATRLNLPINTVSIRIHRARRHLRKMLAPGEGRVVQ